MIDSPAEVENLVKREIGPGIKEFIPISRGATLAAKWIIRLDDGSSYFVKTASDERGIRELRCEQKLLAALPCSVAPRMVAFTDSPPISIMEDLSSDEWSPAFSDSGKALFDLLHTIELLDPPDWLYRLTGPSSADSNWAAIAANPGPFLGLHVCSKEWFENSINSLITAEKRVSRSGNSLIHGDIHGENICYTGSRAFLVDWGNACIGNANIDRLSALLAVRIRTGKTPVIEFDDAFAWASWQAGRHAKMGITPRPGHIRDDSVLRTPDTTYLRHALEWAAEAGLLAKIR